MSSHVSPSDEGKPVIDANGDRLGTVERVVDGTAFVEPNDDVSTFATLVLGWDDTDGSYPLEDLRIDTVSDDWIRLKSNL
jgi:hypothetical protein